MKKPTPITSSTVTAHWSKKRNVLIDAAVILLVAAIIGVVWWIGHRPDPEPTPVVAQYSGQALVDEVQKRYALNDYLGAINLIKGQKTINERDTQLVLAVAYSNSNQHAKAVAIFDNLEKSKPLPEGDAALAAEVAERDKQYQKAVDYFKKAKDRADAEAVDQIALYDYKIAELEKKL